MTELTVPYPPPPPGLERDLRCYIQQDVLSPHSAAMLLQQGFAWSVVAPYVNDTQWWELQRPALAPAPTQPWCITSWGATLFLETQGIKICVDPGPDMPDLRELPDLIIVTHAHHDHTAKLGTLWAANPEIPVMMSEGTYTLLSLRHQPDDALHKCLRHSTLKLKYSETRKVLGVQVTLLPAGHLLGAAMIEIEYGGDTLLVTGDFAARDVGGFAGAPWPQKPYSLLLLGITALNQHQLPTADPQANRMPFLQEVDTLSRQGRNRILVNTQAMSQAQELYVALVLAQQAGAFPNLSVYLAGFAKDISQQYHKALEKRHRAWYCTPLYLEIDEVPENAIVIAGSLGEIGSGIEENPLIQSVTRDQQGWYIRNPNVYTHASWGECAAWALGISCYAAGIYGSFSLSLFTMVQNTGRRVWDLSREDKVWKINNL